MRTTLMFAVLICASACAGRDFSILNHKGKWPARTVDVRLIGTPPTPAPRLVIIYMGAHPWACPDEDTERPPGVKRGPGEPYFGNHMFILSGNTARHLLRVKPGFPATRWSVLVPGRNRAYTDDEGQTPLRLPWPSSKVDRSKRIVRYEIYGQDETPFLRLEPPTERGVEAVLKKGWIGLAEDEDIDRNILQFLSDPDGSNAHYVGPWDPGSTTTFLPVEHIFLRPTGTWFLPYGVRVMRKAGDELEKRTLAGYRQIAPGRFEFLWVVRFLPLPRPRTDLEGGPLGSGSNPIIHDLR